MSNNQTNEHVKNKKKKKKLNHQRLKYQESWKWNRFSIHIVAVFFSHHLIQLRKKYELQITNAIEQTKSNRASEEWSGKMKKKDCET